MLRVDLEQRTVAVSVRDLAYPPGTLPRVAGAVGALRAELGSVVHRAYRIGREDSVPGFRAEVTLTWDHTVDGFEVRLSGRLDGLIEEEPGRLRIEEVKSTERTGAELAGITLDGVDSQALRQARLYALILARTRPEAVLQVDLVLISIVEHTTRTLPVPFDAGRTERHLDRAIRELIADERRRALRATERATFADRLRFPFDGYRPHQQELIETIAEGLADRRPVLAEAPTGIGKTISALLPALEFALGNDALVFFLTAKRTQRALVATTFERLFEATDLPRGTVRAMTLRPRDAMCPTGKLHCHVDHCSLLANLQRKEPRETVLQELLADTAHLTPDQVYAAGDRNGLCPHVLAQMLSAHMDLVIGDYNHVYARAAEPGVFPGRSTPRPVVVIADEAHNLYDRVREYDSVFLPREQVAELAERWVPLEPSLFGYLCEPVRPDVTNGVARALRELAALMDQTIREAIEESPASTDGRRAAALDRVPWEALADRCAWLLVGYIGERDPLSGPAWEDPVVDVLGNVVRIRDLLRRNEPGLVPYACCGSFEDSSAGVGIVCVDPAPRLRERHRQMLATVAMSATLSPAEHYVKGLGFEGSHPVEISLPSPFPAENRRVLVVPTVDTTWRKRARAYGRIARLVESVFAAHPGHYAAYFPSFRFLDEVRERLSLPTRTILTQRPRMPDHERRACLDRLRDDPEPVLLLAVAGGILAEGVDLPGDALIGVIVVGPSIPPIGFERDAMRRYHEERDEDGFARALVYPGMQRVIQAAGRVHRTPEDRGVIVLLGERFARPPYADCLPTAWSRYGVGELVSHDPAEDLEGFWSDVQGT